MAAFTCEDLLNDERLPATTRAAFLKAVEEGDRHRLHALIQGAIEREEYDRIRLLDSTFKVKEIRNRIAKRVEKEAAYHIERGVTDPKKIEKIRAKELKKAYEEEIGGAGVLQRTENTSYEANARARFSELIGGMQESLQKIQPRFMLGKRSPKFETEVMTYLYGGAENVSKGAQDLGRQIQDMTDKVWDTLTSLGVPIKYRKNYGIPMNHDATKIKDMGFDNWRKLVEDTMDMDAINQITSDMDSALRSVYDNIVSQDTKNFDDAFLSDEARKLFSRSFQKERFFQPADGVGYQNYLAKAGVATTPYEAIIKYADLMARDIEGIRKFGLDANRTIQKMKNDLIKAGDNQNYGNRMEKMWQFARYRNLSADMPTFGKIIGDLKSIQTITKLTMTPATALTDLAFGTAVKLFKGYPPAIRARRRLLRLNPGSVSDRQIAAKIGVVEDTIISDLSHMSRFTELTGHRKLAMAADASTKISGLKDWTNIQTRAASLDFMSAIMLDDLKPNFIKMMKGYGISEAELDLLKTSSTTINGAKFLDLTKDVVPEELKIKALSAMYHEVDLMVPKMGIAARAVLTPNVKMNHPAHAVWDAMTQFKGFGVSMYLTHMIMGMDMFRQGGMQAAYFPFLFMSAASMSIIGGMAKDIAKGKDPRKLNDAHTYIEAAAGAGVFGPLADIALQDPNIGDGLLGAFAGPVVSSSAKVLEYLTKPIHKAIEDGTMDGMWESYSKGAYQGLEKNAFFNRLLYTRAFWDHTLGKKLNEMVDPHYKEKQSWMEDFLYKQGRGDYINEGRMPELPW